MTVDDAEPKPLRYVVDLSRILEHTGASLIVDDVLDLGALEVGGERFEPVRPTAFEITLINSGSGVVATGTVTAAYAAECSRCLETFEMPLAGAIERFFVDPSTVESVPEEQDYELVNHGRIDLGPALLEALTLELPFVPLHSPECQGICPTCGAALSTAPCSCPVAAPESPFGALAGLLDQAQDDEDDSTSD